MWIRFLKVVDEHKVNDFLDVDEPIARAYIATGQAKEEKDGPEKYLLEQARSEYMASLRDFARDTAATMREAATGLQRRPGVIEPGEAEADKTRGVGDFVRQVYWAHHPEAEIRAPALERIQKVYGSKRAMTEGTGAAGGFLTPTLYESQLQSAAAENAVIAPKAKQIPLGARTVEWPALDQYQTPTAGQSAFFGGVKVYRKGEGTSRTSSSPTLKKIALTAQDLTAFSDHISRDLLEDATTPIDQLITDLIGKALGWRTDWEVLQGSGSGQFLGIYNAPCTIQVTRNTSSHIKYVDLTSMYKRLLPESLGRAYWVIHPYTMDELLQIQDGGSRYIFQPYVNVNGDSTLGAAPKWQMLGLPVVSTEKAPMLGSTGDIGLFDPMAYLLGSRSGIEIGLSEHFRFDTDELAIRAKVRNDGQPWLKSSIILADGTATVSAFIVLN